MSRGPGTRGYFRLPSDGDGSSLRIGLGQGTLPRASTWTNVAVLAGSGTAAFQHFRAVRTQTITTIRTFTATTAAAATPTVCKVGLYSMAANGDISRVGISANDTTLWAAANTAYSTALLAGAPVVAGQDYMVGMVIVTGAATPTHVGLASSSTPTGFLTGYVTEYPQFVGLATSQTDLNTSYTKAQIATAPHRPFFALLLP